MYCISKSPAEATMAYAAEQLPETKSVHYYPFHMSCLGIMGNLA